MRLLTSKDAKDVLIEEIGTKSGIKKEKITKAVATGYSRTTKLKIGKIAGICLVMAK